MAEEKQKAQEQKAEEKQKAQEQKADGKENKGVIGSSVRFVDNKAKKLYEKFSDFINFFQTPLEIFLFIISTIAVFIIISSSVFYSCKVVDQTGQGEKILRKGSVVLVDSSAEIDELTCGIVSQVYKRDESEKGSISIRLLSKDKPIDESKEEVVLDEEGNEIPFKYNLLTFINSEQISLFDKITFLNKTPERIEVPITENLIVLSNGDYTDGVRDIIFNKSSPIFFFFIFVILLIIAIGYKFKRERVIFYERHTLRANYLSKLVVKDKEKLKSMRKQVEGIIKDKEIDNAKEDIDYLIQSMDYCFSVVFDKNLDDAFNLIKEKEFHLIKKLKKEVNKYKQNENINESEYLNIISTFRDCFIWVGVLEHYYFNK